jgi:hypothetical protein
MLIQSIFAQSNLIIPCNFANYETNHYYYEIKANRSSFINYPFDFTSSCKNIFPGERTGHTRSDWL